jgi:pyruvate formate lyase activating enzyme
MLVHAANLGRRAGLRFVYAGNRPGHVGDLEHTRCPSCTRTLVQRYGYLVQAYEVTPDGHCPDCGATIPGRWDAAYLPQRAAWPFLPGRRLRTL